MVNSVMLTLYSVLNTNKTDCAISSGFNDGIEARDSSHGISDLGSTYPLAKRISVFTYPGDKL